MKESGCSLAAIRSTIFDDNFDDPGLVLKTESALTMASGFCVSCVDDESREELGLFYTKKDSKKSESIYYGEDLKLYLKENRAYQLALRLFQRITEFTLRFQRSSKMVATSWEEDIKYYHSLLETLLTKSIAHRAIDCLLSFSLMLALPQKTAFDGLRSGLTTVNNDFGRLIQISRIGIDASKIWQQRTFTVQLETLAKNAKWWEELKVLDIPFEEDKFRTDDPYRRSLIGPLFLKTSFDLHAVLEFAGDYNIEG